MGAPYAILRWGLRVFNAKVAQKETPPEGGLSYALTTVVVIAVGSPFVGLVLGGLPGVLVGLVLSGISYWFGRSASKAVHEITKTIRHH